VPRSTPTGPGSDLVAVVDTLRRKGFQIGGETLATRPEGVAADHPRLELLRHKSLIAWRDRGTPAWMSTGSVVRYVRGRLARDPADGGVDRRARRTDHDARPPARGRR
jgi:hypothetical protein